MNETLEINSHLSPARAVDVEGYLRQREDGICIRTAPELVANSLYILQAHCHEESARGGWWPDLTEAGIDAATPAKIALIHSEVSEALEGFRKDVMDKHLTDRKSGEVELADAVIRIFDLADAHGYDLGEAVIEKLRYNATREDHTPEARAAEGGKKF